MLSRREFLAKTSLLSLSAMVSPFSSAFSFGDTKRNSTNPWLDGNYAPVFDELTVANLSVQGEIPNRLNGMFLRNGPNPIYPPTPYHWFDGDGMIHALHLQDGKASYINRFIQTEGYLREKAAGKSLYGGILADRL